MRLNLLALNGILVAGVLAIAGTASAAEALEPLGAPFVAIDAAFVAQYGVAERRATQTLMASVSSDRIFDLSRVEQDPVMRARRDFSLMAALPTLSGASAPINLKGLIQTKVWKLGRDVMLTFPLAITGRNLVTAEVAGAGSFAIRPTGFQTGGVFSFSRDF